MNEVEQVEQEKPATIVQGIGYIILTIMRVIRFVVTLIIIAGMILLGIAVIWALVIC